MDALLVVDFQNDFTPGGALAVPDGDEIRGPIGELIDSFDLVVATRDWHPPDHGSFAGVEVDPASWNGTDPPSIWPVHCVQGTPGADFELAAGFLAAEAVALRDILRLPSEVDPVGVVTLGHPAPDRRAAALARGRRPHSVHWERGGGPPPERRPPALT
jgi:hypothetical protein